MLFKSVRNALIPTKSSAEIPRSADTTISRLRYKDVKLIRMRSDQLDGLFQVGEPNRERRCSAWASPTMVVLRGETKSVGCGS